MPFLFYSDIGTSGVTSSIDTYFFLFIPALLPGFRVRDRRVLAFKSNRSGRDYTIQESALVYRYLFFIFFSKAIKEKKKQEKENVRTAQVTISVC